MIEKKPDQPMQTPSRFAPAPHTQQGTSVVRRTVSSSELLAGGNELLIEHNGGVYSLRQTSNGKLILTK